MQSPLHGFVCSCSYLRPCRESAGSGPVPAEPPTRRSVAEIGTPSARAAFRAADGDVDGGKLEKTDNSPVSSGLCAFPSLRKTLCASSLTPQKGSGGLAGSSNTFGGGESARALRA